MLLTESETPSKVNPKRLNLHGPYSQNEYSQKE